MAVITSVSNAQVKQVRALRERRERNRTGLFYAEGLRVVLEALNRGAPVEKVIVAPDLLTSQAGHNAVRLAQSRGVCTLEVSAAVFKTLSQREHPVGLACVAHQRWGQLASLPAGTGCWVAIEGAQDPGNLGSILRTADAAGAAGIMLLGEGTDPYHPSAVRASMGAVFACRLVSATPAELFRWAARTGCTLIGASGDGAIDYRAVAYRPPLVLLMGTERAGLSEQVLAACHQVVRIPMVGTSDSLNVAVATGLLLYEAFRHRHPARL
jgi:RNA methyltransferase, TrmH family